MQLCLAKSENVMAIVGKVDVKSEWKRLNDRPIQQFSDGIGRTRACCFDETGVFKLLPFIYRSIALM